MLTEKILKIKDSVFVFRLECNDPRTAIAKSPIQAHRHGDIVAYVFAGEFGLKAQEIIALVVAKVQIADEQASVAAVGVHLDGYVDVCAFNLFAEVERD